MRTDSQATLVDDAPVTAPKPGRTVAGGDGVDAPKPARTVADSGGTAVPKPVDAPRPVTATASTDGHGQVESPAPRPEPAAPHRETPATDPVHPADRAHPADRTQAADPADRPKDDDPAPTRPDPDEVERLMAPWWFKDGFPSEVLAHWSDEDLAAAAYRVVQHPLRSYPDPGRPGGGLMLHEGEVDGLKLVVGVEDGRIWQIHHGGPSDPPQHQEPRQQPHHPDDADTVTLVGDGPSQPTTGRRTRDEYEADHRDDADHHAVDHDGTHDRDDLGPAAPSDPEPQAKRPRPDPSPSGPYPFDAGDGTPQPLLPLDSFLHTFSGDGYDAAHPDARWALEQAMGGAGRPERFAHPSEWVGMVNPRDEGGSLLSQVNCGVAAMAFHAGFHGDPQVAPLPRERPRGALADAQEWTGHPAEYVGLGSAGLDEVARRITEGGPGSGAMVFAWRENGKGHAWNLVNVPGDGLVWVDAQQGLHSPGDQPLPTEVTRVWAIMLDGDNRPIPGGAGFNAAAGDAAEQHVRPTVAADFTGTDQQGQAGSSSTAPDPGGTATGSSSSGAATHGTLPPPEAPFPAPGPRVPVTGDGLCLLNSVATSDPSGIARLLADRGMTGRGISVSFALKEAVSQHLTTTGAANLPPEVTRGYRKIATAELQTRYAARSRSELLAGLAGLGVGGVTTHEVVPTRLLRERYLAARTDELAGPGGDRAAARHQAELTVPWKFKSPAEQSAAEDYLRGHGVEPATDAHDLRRQYIDERVARGENLRLVEEEIGWNLGDGAVGPEQQFHHLLGTPHEVGLHDLPDASLVDLNVRHLTLSDRPLSPTEFTGLQQAVRNWERSWHQGFGETFPPLLADTLGLRLRILGPDGQGGSTEYLRYGPTDGHQVTVYYNGSNHYDASAAPLPAPGASATPHPPAAPPTVVPGASSPTPTGTSTGAPVPPPAPHSVSTVGGGPTTHPTGTTHPAPPPPSAPSAPPSAAPHPGGTAPHAHPAPPSIVVTPPDHISATPAGHPPSPQASVFAMSVFSHDSQTHDHDPAFTPRKPVDPADVRLPPARVTNHKRLSASDLVVGLHQEDTVVFRRITDLFKAGFKGDLPAARTIAQDFFDPMTLRPKLTALSRGDVWEAPFEANGWKGTVSIRVDAENLVYQETAPSVEFENGADRYASLGVQEDSLNRFNAGFQAKFKTGKTDFTETFGYHHDEMHGAASLDVGRTIARGKTVEPGALFAGKLHLALDFTELTHHGQPVELAPGIRVQRLDIGATIGIPERDTLDAHGHAQPLAKDKLFAPPQRVVEGHRLGGSDIVLDVSTHRHGRPDADRPMEEVLDGVEDKAKEVVGDLWPKLREKMIAELDLTRLHQDLKSMMSGERTRIEVTGDRGIGSASVEITASVKAMWQTGTTPQTEFNVGTGVQRVRTQQDTSSDGLQLPLPTQVSGSGAGASIGSGGAGLQLIRDQVQISGTSQESQITTKTKGAGVVFDGRAELRLNFEHKGLTGGSHDTATTTVDFRALIEQAEARPVVDTPGSDPTLFIATDVPQAATAKTFEPGSTIPSPPDAVWQHKNGAGGLSDTVTVRDLPTVAPLHEQVEKLGRELLKDSWNDVKDDIHQLFSHPMVASRLTSMTRDIPLEAPERTAATLLKHGVKVSATATVTEMAYKRPEAKAELNPVDETTSFSSGRRLISDTKSVQGTGGGTVPLSGKDTLDISGGYARQVRDRAGWRDGNSNKVYANGKYARPQEIYDAALAVQVKVTVDGTEHTLTVPIRAELSLDRKETGNYVVGADGLGVFTGPGAGTPNPHKAPAELHDPPRRIAERGAMSASDVVHSLGGGDATVLRSIEDRLKQKFGNLPDDAVMKLKNRFDPFALKPQLSKLSRGGKLTETVSVNGWDATVTVKAALGKDFVHTDTVEKFEFELGTQTRVSTGVGKDRRIRDIFSLPTRLKLPHLDLGFNAARRTDLVSGSTVDSTGATVSKGKSVEPAGLFTGTADFTVEFEFRTTGEKHGAPDLKVPVRATVATPLRDAPLHGAPDPAPVKKPLDPPARIERTHRLGSSDVVTDVYPLRPRGGPGGPGGPGAGPDPAGPHRSVAESAVHHLGGTASRALGGDWAGIKEKITKELELDKLQPQLKSMMSGHEIVVKHGRSTVRITAAVSRMEHTGETAQTEFNTGTQVQKSFASSDGVTSFGSGKGNSITVSAQGTSNPLPVGPAVTGGVQVTHSWGHDQLDVQAQRTSTGAATKAKVPGSGYTGEATLIFRMERRPLVDLGRDRIVPDPHRPTPPATRVDQAKAAAGGAWRALRRLGTSTHALATAKVGFQATVEAVEGRPSKGGAPTPFEAPDHRTAPAHPAPSEPPVEVTVKAPPARVWNEGLRDIDVMRWLGDSSGVQDILRLHGPGFFGSRTWDRMESVARNTTDHAQLASHFGSATRGEEIATPSPGRRLLVSDGGVEVNLKVLQLEYDRTDGKVELSPSNATSTTSTRTRLDWSMWSGQGQGGVKMELGSVEGTFQAIVGGAHRGREGLSLGNAGQVVSHAKFGTPMARYDGFAEVEVVMFKGDKRVVEKGVIPISVDIPERETHDAKVMSDHYLAFSQDAPDGTAIPKNPRTDALGEAFGDTDFDALIGEFGAPTPVPPRPAPVPPVQPQPQQPVQPQPQPQAPVVQNPAPPVQPQPHAQPQAQPPAPVQQPPVATPPVQPPAGGPVHDPVVQQPAPPVQPQAQPQPAGGAVHDPVGRPQAQPAAADQVRPPSPARPLPEPPSQAPSSQGPARPGPVRRVSDPGPRRGPEEEPVTLPSPHRRVGSADEQAFFALADKSREGAFDDAALGSVSSGSPKLTAVPEPHEAPVETMPEGSADPTPVRRASDPGPRRGPEEEPVTLPSPHRRVGSADEQAFFALADRSREGAFDGASLGSVPSGSPKLTATPEPHEAPMEMMPLGDESPHDVSVRRRQAFGGTDSPVRTVTPPSRPRVETTGLHEPWVAEIVSPVGPGPADPVPGPSGLIDSPKPVEPGDRRGLDDIEEELDGSLDLADFITKALSGLGGD
ncbi:toxin glutamine deamidase domain-containing protein [Kitasatospora sp. NPDC094015]|uniref:toxin glutamine deamidase domain-containing protein n=1 Tax=Kitasatospora sp. NPDC094015 TaxID=3155205 RepID=UPI00331E6F65